MMRGIVGAALTLMLSACAAAPPFPRAKETQIKWESRFASPGTRLTYKETSRVSSLQGTGVTYKLWAEGLPKEKMYSLWGKWINGRTAEMYKALHVDGSGRVVREDGTALEFGLRKMLEGESI